MLVLTRKYQEKIHIGDGITITILRTKGKAVRLGIEAPPEVPVIRGELSFHNSPATANTDKFEKQVQAADLPRTSVRASATASVARPWHGETIDGKTNPRVLHHRVPRDKSAEILPRLLAGGAPLREMMQRTKTM